MFEDIAFEFVNQSEDRLQLIGIGLAIIGALIAAIVTRSKAEIPRAPYFAYSALIFFAVSAAQIVWLQSIPAMKGGYLWVIIAISLAAILAGGFFGARIAIARSRDAYPDLFTVTAGCWGISQRRKAAGGAGRRLISVWAVAGVED